MFGIETMNYPLPEDILIRKYAGDLEGAKALIDIYLSENRTPLLNDRLRLERYVLDRLPADFPYTRAEALDMLLKELNWLTEADFDRLEAHGDILYMYINGEKRYFDSFLSSLYKLRPDVTNRVKPSGADPLLDDAIAELKRAGSLAYRIHMRCEMSVDDDAFTPGKYRAFLPLPAATAQQSDIRVISPTSADAILLPEDAPARAAIFVRDLQRSEPFAVEYEYTSRIVYCDPDRPAPSAPLYPAAAPVTPEDTAEQPGQIVFTPYLKALCADICGAERDPLKKARRIYDYITTHMRYSYQRAYFTLPQMTEYAATGLKGDCGIQALLFITLCRIAGIPARWQSGLSGSNDPLKSMGCHDWAQFYVDGWGWLFADPSYGTGARRAGSEVRRNFYFGNLDPFRMAANSVFQPVVDPAKRYIANDPYDNQSGECESERAPLHGESLTKKQVVLSAVKL